MTTSNLMLIFQQVSGALCELLTALTTSWAQEFQVCNFSGPRYKDFEPLHVPRMELCFKVWSPLLALCGDSFSSSSSNLKLNNIQVHWIQLHITLFRSIKMLCGTHSILQKNLLHSACMMKYFAKYCQSHIRKRVPPRKTTKLNEWVTRKLIRLGKGRSYLEKYINIGNNEFPGVTILIK